LPAKSLTQIKTYFQNSKAKLGLLNPEGLNISVGRGAGSRKRKADDSDTSSNNVGSMTTTNELKSSSILPTDVDVVSQKVNSAMAALPGMPAAMSVGIGPVGVDNLPYSLFNARMEDQMTVQKFIRQMCNANGFAQNSQGLYPFLQHGLPLFPNPGLQRTPHSNLQQQLAASLSQKSSQSVGLQQPLQSSGVQHNSQPNLHPQAAHQLQTAQVARSQQQLLQNIMQQQAAHLQQQQQHQTSKGVLHPLQQQVRTLLHICTLDSI
jgi:nuclear receptor co-repressor 1